MQNCTMRLIIASRKHRISSPMCSQKRTGSSGTFVSGLGRENHSLRIESKVGRRTHSVDRCMDPSSTAIIIMDCHQPTAIQVR